MVLFMSDMKCTVSELSFLYYMYYIKQSSTTTLPKHPSVQSLEYSVFGDIVENVSIQSYSIIKAVVIDGVVLD